MKKFINFSICLMLIVSIVASFIGDFIMQQFCLLNAVFLQIVLVERKVDEIEDRKTTVVHINAPDYEEIRQKFYDAFGGKSQ